MSRGYDLLLVKKHGNSFCITVPKEIVNDLELEGKTFLFDLTVTDKKIELIYYIETISNKGE